MLPEVICHRFPLLLEVSHQLLKDPDEDLLQITRKHPPAAILLFLRRRHFDLRLRLKTLFNIVQVPFEEKN